MRWASHIPWRFERGVRICEGRAFAPRRGRAAPGFGESREPDGDRGIARRAGYCRALRAIRLVREWVTSIGLEPSAYGTHSMRRTKVAQIYRKTGNLRAVQLLVGHTKMDSTVRYLGMDLEDALTISEGMEI